MANILKTTLKKDIIADIADNNKREVRFPITKFWATRFASEYNLDDKTFVFKTFDSLEFSSPSNKDTDAMTYVFDFVRTFVDGDEFVIEFKDSGKQDVENIDDAVKVENETDANIAEENVANTDVDTDTDDIDGSDTYTNDDIECDTEDEYISNEDVFDTIRQWFDDENIADSIFENESVFATNGMQIIIRPRGRVLGINKTLPLNNDNDVRVEFDKQIKIYFPTSNEFDDLDVFELFKNQILESITEITKNNFLFVWKRYTGIFMESDSRIYFGMKYATRRIIGFDRRYNVQ